MNEHLIVEVEMKARDALTQFEKLDAQFRETAGNNKQLYQELWRQHKKYVGDVARENKQRAADEAWLTRELSKEGEKRKSIVLKEAREERRFADELTKEMQQRVKDERWLTRELEKEQKQRERDAERAAKEAERAHQKTSRFGGMGGIGDKVMLAYGAVDAARGLATLADRGFRAADSLAGVHRGLETVYGSSERAASRFKELNELAKFPGLDPEPLARFDAIFKNLGSTAEQNDTLFTGLAKAVTTFGGDVFNVSSALYQLSQGFAKNKIDAQDFKSISEQTGGTFMKTAQEVLGFTGGIEGMRAKFKESGETLQEFLMPVFVQFNKEFQGAPVDSYTNAIDNLGVAFKNLTAEIFSNASFVGKFLGHITEFVEGEKELWKEMRTGGEAIKAIGEDAQLSAAQLSVLQKDLGRVSAALETQTEKYKELEDKGVNPNTASMQHLERSIKGLEATHEKFSGRVETAKSKMMEMLKPVEDINTEFRVLKVETEQVDTRFMSFRERGDALKSTIRELPPAITAVHSGFDALAPTAARVNALFTEYNETLGRYVAVSGIVVSSAEEEAKALDAVTQQFIQQTQDAKALAHVQEVLTQRTDAHNASLVNPAVSDATDSMRDYIGVMGDVQSEFKTVKEISDGLRTSIKDQATAFDELRRTVDTAEISLDDIDETFDRIPDAIDPSIVSMETFETVALRALREIGKELSAFEGTLGNIGVGVDNMVTLFTNPVSFAAGTLGSVIEGLSNINKFGGALGLPEGFFDDPVPGQAKVHPSNISQGRQLAENQTHHAGIARYLNTSDPLAQIEMLKANDPGIFQRHNTRAFIEQNFPELVDVIYPRGQGFNVSGVRAKQQGARTTAEATGTDQAYTDQIAFESGMMTPAEEARYLAGSPDEPTGAPTGAPTGEPSQRAASSGSSSRASTGSKPPEIREVHRFTGGESETLKNLEGTLKEKRTNLMQLGEDADFTTVLDRYGEYTAAIQDLYDSKFAFIKQSEHITGGAESAALTAALQEFNSLTFRANQDLARAISKTGDTLVNSFDATTGILQRGQIQRGVVPGDEHKGVVKASTPRMKTVGGSSARSQPSGEKAPAEVHRFASGESGTLRTVNNEVKRQREDFRNTRDADFTEILNKYGAYTAAIQKLYDEKIAFINNAKLTSGAASTAQQLALDEFYKLTFIANEDLAYVLAENGSKLVNEFSTTTGVLARNQIIRGVVVEDTPDTVTHRSRGYKAAKRVTNKKPTDPNAAARTPEAFPPGDAVARSQGSTGSGSGLERSEALASIRTLNVEAGVVNISGAGTMGEMMREAGFPSTQMERRFDSEPENRVAGKRTPIEWHDRDGTRQWGNFNNLGTFIPRWRPTADPAFIESERQRRENLGSLGSFFEDTPDVRSNTTDYGRVANILQDYKTGSIEIGSKDFIIKSILERAKTVPGFHYESLLELLNSVGFDQREFHFPQSDRLALLAGSQTARAMSANPTPTQMENARDFSTNFGNGLLNELRNVIDGQQAQSPVNLNLTLMIDSEQLVTPRFTEKVSDQLSINEQSGNARR